MSESADASRTRQRSGLSRGNTHRLTLEQKRRIRARCAQWKFSNPEYREPPIGGLAKECGVRASTLRAIMSRLPNTLREYLELCQVHTLPRFLEIANNLADKAAGGDKQAVIAAKLIVEGMALPELKKAKPAKEPEMSKAVIDVFNMVVEAKQRARQRARAAENATDEQEIPSRFQRSQIDRCRTIVCTRPRRSKHPKTRRPL